MKNVFEIIVSILLTVVMVLILLLVLLSKSLIAVFPEISDAHPGGALRCYLCGFVEPWERRHLAMCCILFVELNRHLVARSLSLALGSCYAVYINALSIYLKPT